MANEDKAIQIKNKVHLLTFFIVACEEEKPLEEDEDEWHPEFEDAIAAVLKINEDGYLDQEEMHEFNDLFKKWGNRFEQLGLDEVPVERWREEEDLEEEIFDLLETYVNQDDS